MFLEFPSKQAPAGSGKVNEPLVDGLTYLVNTDHLISITYMTEGVHNASKEPCYAVLIKNHPGHVLISPEVMEWLQEIISPARCDRWNALE